MVPKILKGHMCLVHWMKFRWQSNTAKAMLDRIKCTRCWLHEYYLYLKNILKKKTKGSIRIYILFKGFLGYQKKLQKPKY